MAEISLLCIKLGPQTYAVGFPVTKGLLREASSWSDGTRKKRTGERRPMVNFFKMHLLI